MTNEDYEKIIEELKAENKRLRLEEADALSTTAAAIKRIKKLEAMLPKYKHVAPSIRTEWVDLKAELVKAKEALECAKLYIENINFAEMTGDSND